MLIENTLYGVNDKIKIAIERVQAFEPPDGYYVAFSGGKDSIVVKDLVRRSGVKYDIHFNLTTVDPPELLKYIREYHKDVEICIPQKSMRQLIIDHRIPPLCQIRFCCAELKENGGIGRLVITGVRWAESVRRRKRQMSERCLRDGGKSYLHPIIDWTDREVWEYIRTQGLPYCSLYDEGFKRIGCVMCPMGGKKGMSRDAERWPIFAEMYKQACIAAFDKRVKDGLPKAKKWTSGEGMYEWWIEQAESNTGNPAQTILFE